MITVNTDIQALNKGRKFIYFTNGENRSENLTFVQAKTVIETFRSLNIEVVQNDGLTF